MAINLGHLNMYLKKLVKALLIVQICSYFLRLLVKGPDFVRDFLAMLSLTIKFMQIRPISKLVDAMLLSFTSFSEIASIFIHPTTLVSQFNLLLSSIRIMIIIYRHSMTHHHMEDRGALHISLA